ncbi:MAG: endonuclease/exonuclease/phosphatase family protein [Gemmataceae bacterium]|nr:endonuclease/exonuclease/phosphatase family protein [Gemmataceae bacterium]
MRSLLVLSALLLAAPHAAAQGKAKAVLLCFWNVENLFDDQINPKLEKADREFDDYFGKDKAALAAKLDRVADVLLSREMAGGTGPDILCLAEVESRRAVELVQGALHKRLKDKGLHYPHLAYLDPGGGRSIATAVLSRLPFAGKPALLSSQRRILKVVVEKDRKPLTVIASHWSSRISDKTGKGRASYAEAIYKDYAAAFKKDRNVDYLVCGDFNDTPEDDAVANVLGALPDSKKVLDDQKNGRAAFFHPFAKLAKAGKGTHWFKGKGFVFDHIVLSPGLLDGEGWQYRNNSAQIVEKLKFRDGPDRFGGPMDRRPFKNRGASDHFPVTVELLVNK